MPVICCESCSKLFMVDDRDVDAAKQVHLDSHLAKGQKEFSAKSFPVYQDIESAFDNFHSGRVEVFDAGKFRLPRSVPSA